MRVERPNLIAFRRPALMSWYNFARQATPVWAIWSTVKARSSPIGDGGFTTGPRTRVWYCLRPPCFFINDHPLASILARDRLCMSGGVAHVKNAATPSFRIRSLGAARQRDRTPAGVWTAKQLPSPSGAQRVAPKPAVGQRAFSPRLIFWTAPVGMLSG
jgi:hypothetical protein